MIGSYLEQCNNSKELLIGCLIPPACYPLISFYHQAGSGSLLLLEARHWLQQPRLML